MMPRVTPALRATLLVLLVGLPTAPLLAATPTSADAPTSADESVAEGIEHLQQRWAEIHYTLPKDEQATALEALAAEADRRVAAHPEAAGLQIWAGIVRSTQAGASGGLGALSLVKDARRDLEQALAIDPLALDGSAYTSLGALYYQVPGWPLAFGDDDKAEHYLKRALSIDPDGLDSLYFWGDYLHEQGRDTEARQALEKALQAPPRPGRERADAGRREEVRALLETLGT